MEEPQRTIACILMQEHREDNLAAFILSLACKNYKALAMIS